MASLQAEHLAESILWIRALPRVDFDDEQSCFLLLFMLRKKQDVAIHLVYFIELGHHGRIDEADKLPVVKLDQVLWLVSQSHVTQNDLTVI